MKQNLQLHVLKSLTDTLRRSDAQAADEQEMKRMKEQMDNL